MHTVEPRVVAANASWAYQLSVLNAGGVPATGLRLVSLLPPGLTTGDVQAAGCRASEGAVVCEWDSLAAGASQALAITASAAAPGAYTSSALLSAESPASDQVASATALVASPDGPNPPGPDPPGPDPPGPGPEPPVYPESPDSAGGCKGHRHCVRCSGGRCARCAKGYRLAKGSTCVPTWANACKLFERHCALCDHRRPNKCRRW